MTTDPSFLWSLLCDHFLIDQAGKYSFIGVFDRIGALSFPVVQRSLYIAVALEGEPNSSAPGLLDVWSPEGTLLVSTPESRLQFSNAGRAMFVNLIYDLQLPGPGQYSITVEAGGKPISSFGFEVYLSAPTAGEQPLPWGGSP
jgi:hypothetical protein